MRFINGGRPTPRAEIETDILPWWLEYYERYAGLRLLGGDRAGERRVRRLVPPAPGRRRPCRDEPELGYRLRASSWGKGYATEGSRALVDHAFRELGAERVTAETMAVNTASRRVMEKAGLRYVRTFHADWPDKIDGDEHGDVEYALTRAEWSRSQVT